MFDECYLHCLKNLPQTVVMFKDYVAIFHMLPADVISVFHAVVNIIQLFTF